MVVRRDVKHSSQDRYEDMKNAQYPRETMYQIL
jgi:hypothetical protein